MPEEMLDIDEENISKRRRTVTDNDKENEDSNQIKLVKNKQERCNICKQYLDEIVYYNGHPNNACLEDIALIDDKLSLFTGEEVDIVDADNLPVHKVTNFTVYDENGHICPFDTGLIEKDVVLLFSAYVKPIYDEDPSINNGIPAYDMGPIHAWWTAGYDGGEKALVGFTTTYAEYYLMEPSDDYAPFWNNLQSKIYLSKIVIEYLMDEGWQNPSYEDLLQHIQSSGKFPLGEETLLRHAQFLCDQVVSFDQAARDEETPLIVTPCMRTLIQLAGVTFRKRKQMRSKGSIVKKEVQTWTKAVTTKLVHDVFENFFPDQLDRSKTDKGPKRRRCGVCEACQSPDCGVCSHCKDMLKFGGTGRGKQACKQRKCPNMAIQEAEDNDNAEEKESGNETVKHTFCSSKRILHKVVFLDDPIDTVTTKKIYKRAQVGDLVVQEGDYVILNSENPNEPFYIARIMSMYEKFPTGRNFHAHYLMRGNETVLGETADPRELFIVDDCDDVPLGSIVHLAEVEYRQIMDDWYTSGGLKNLPVQLEDDGKTFYFSKRYEPDHGRFVDYVENSKNIESTNSCDSCRRKAEKKNAELAKFDDDKVYWLGEKYKIGTSVFLKPEVYKFKKLFDFPEKDKESKTGNSEIYTEYFRKTSENIKGSNSDTPDCFIVGLITDIKKVNNDIKLRVRIFFRPENTIQHKFLMHEKDLNLVYWTEEVIDTSFNNICGKCYVIYGENVANATQWIGEGPNRFYFTESYDPQKEMFGEIPSAAAKVGSKGKGGGKGKGLKSTVQTEIELPPEWAKLERPLRCMDIFAGCGGLSEGLHQAGIAETKWAIEKEIPAANAFRLNNPDCKVFSEDCNVLLNLILTESDEAKKKGLPMKGEVELLVGGPPCQGFSGMNRFNAGQYSLFKNSLAVTFLSYCEYYRPKYFILENVRNFVSFKRGMVIKLTIRCLLAIGYQVAFGVLQAGHYGVPQTRRRLILIAAAPGYELPKLPEPIHVFNKRGCQLSVVINGTRFSNGSRWTDSAPYRTISVRDALSDLPHIRNGCNKQEIAYDSEATTHFQRMMRSTGLCVVNDHICKDMAPIIEARISQIPTYAGADWRDLPNIAMTLKDGTKANTLKYPYRTKKQNTNESPRGVCQCAIGKPCDPSDRQFNTLIPWCLPHTADRHNHWAGLYGRLEWDGFFGTTITNPEPMGKQGRVLHPEQHRVVSVRECARSQGFPDRFKFFGSILDKHRQVGNAVPPPLAKAIGREIAHSLAKSKHDLFA